MIPTLTVTRAPGFRAEQDYILEVLLGEFLGLDFRTEDAPAAAPVVTVSASGRSLRLPQALFCGDHSSWLAGSHPRPACRPLDVAGARLPADRFGGPELPVLYGEADVDGHWITAAGDTLTLHADVLGTSFHLLTRLEEVGSAERDDHDRFPACASLAWAHGFLSRPLVDEHTELLWWALRTQWPNLRRRERTFAVRTSHDVDRPRAYGDARFRDRLWLVRHHARSGMLPRLLGSRGCNGLAATLALPHRDPFDTFESLMDADESQGLRATYNFLSGGSHPRDALYDIRSRRIRRLLRRISTRGHEIGLHGSYATIDDPVRLSDERRRLVAVLGEEGLGGTVDSGRQHYLRWRVPGSWRASEAAGLSVDASAGYPDVVGFRCGTAFEYPVFDVEERRKLRLRERPLHIMDVALSDLDEERSLDAIDQVRRAVARHGGTLEVLWHNNTFAEGQGESVRYARAIARDA